MAQVNPLTRELLVKLVYYGPGLGGKTTSLQRIHQASPAETRGQIVSLATPVDRTLYFDFLPLRATSVRGHHVRLQLFTVPGQVYFNATRKLVLTGADGVVFVADSQRERHDANLESFENLAANLESQGRTLEDMPLVLQYNKRDLPGVMSVAEMDRSLNTLHAPAFATCASEGEGVLSALDALVQAVIDDLADRNALGGEPKPLAEHEFHQAEDALEQQIGRASAEVWRARVDSEPPDGAQASVGETIAAPGSSRFDSVAGEGQGAASTHDTHDTHDPHDPHARHDDAFGDERGEIATHEDDEEDRVSRVVFARDVKPEPWTPSPPVHEASDLTRYDTLRPRPAAPWSGKLATDLDEPGTHAAEIGTPAHGIAVGDRAQAPQVGSDSQRPRRPSLLPAPGAESGPSWATVFGEEATAVRLLELDLQKGRASEAIVRTDALVQRSLEFIGRAADVPEECLHAGVLVPLAGISVARWVAFRGLCKRARSGQNVSVPEAMMAFALLIELRARREELVRR